MWIYTFTPPAHLHGVVLNYLNKRTNIPLYIIICYKIIISIFICFLAEALNLKINYEFPFYIQVQETVILCSPNLLIIHLITCTVFPYFAFFVVGYWGNTKAFNLKLTSHSTPFSEQPALLRLHLLCRLLQTLPCSY
jgi:hypothetical protein